MILGGDISHLKGGATHNFQYTTELVVCSDNGGVQ